MKIILLLKDGTRVEVEVDQAAIAKAAILVLDGRFFTFASMPGQFFADVTFQEVNDPLVLGAGNATAAEAARKFFGQHNDPGDHADTVIVNGWVAPHTPFTADMEAVATAEGKDDANG